MQRTTTGGPASRRALVAFGLLCVLVMGACKAPGGKRTADRVSEQGPPPELGLTPAPIPATELATGTTTTTTPTGNTTQRSTVPPTTPPGGRGTTTSTTVPDTYRTVATVTDGTGDQGEEGPPYADLVRLSVERGTRTMRFTIDMNGPLPAALAGGEVEGVGVDLFRGGVGLEESAYQVFVDGGSDGWRAFFQRGTDIVQFPGGFRLGGGRLELIVPYTAFTDGEPDRASAFADWSRRTDAGNRSAEDHAPELGAVTLAR